MLPGSVMQSEDLQSSDEAQLSPSSHGSQPPPPQSTPVSVPSLSSFEHDVHKPAVHCPLAQSPSTTHICAARSVVALVHKMPRERHTSPPQFLSVSWLSCTLLLHCSNCVSTRHVKEVALHWPVTQSSSPRHREPIVHFCEHAPPQSMSASLPSLSWFVQLTQTRPASPVWQLPLEQSAPVMQREPSTHAEQALLAPPQSTPVSSPFCSPSVHDTQIDASQVPDAQSAPAAHEPPGGQLNPIVEQIPPQSTPDSSAP